ncbi:hypothetical protein NDU88_000714 [Pleurodeles waltl]|uniref:Uncharacterized protein n=1 Tax=Pleurodeles waltl TaxID=8319 RepID=A0AAV7KQS0_PLEWA|nr:hypothetical protein NDU88_000714 [Pleurodeles waltl]
MPRVALGRSPGSSHTPRREEEGRPSPPRQEALPRSTRSFPARQRKGGKQHGRGLLSTSIIGLPALYPGGRPSLRLTFVQHFLNYVASGVRFPSLVGGPAGTRRPHSDPGFLTPACLGTHLRPGSGTEQPLETSLPASGLSASVVFSPLPPSPRREGGGAPPPGAVGFSPLQAETVEARLQQHGAPPFISLRPCAALHHAGVPRQGQRAHTGWHSTSESRGSPRGFTCRPPSWTHAAPKLQRAALGLRGPETPSSSSRGGSRAPGIHL